MRLLKRIWEDIRRGENVDLYVTVVAAIVLVILNIAQIAPQSTIAPLTLAVLALLAISILGSRYQVEKLIDNINKVPRDFLVKKFPETLESDIEKASELWLIGINLRRTLITYCATLEQKLKRGDSLKVLLVDPNGAGCEMAVMRYYVRRDQKYIRMQIQEGLDFLTDLKKIAPDKIEIRTINFPIVFGGFIVDPDTTSGTLYLKYYPFKVEGLPKLVLRVRDGRWYDFFKGEITTLWNQAIPYKSDKEDDD